MVDLRNFMYHSSDNEGPSAWEETAFGYLHAAQAAESPTMWGCRGIGISMLWNAVAVKKENR
jgi:hypothetical protein